VESDKACPVTRLQRHSNITPGKQMGTAIMNGENTLVGLLVILAISIVLFLICREIICWYWKINQSIALLTEIRDLLAQKNSESRMEQGPGSVAPVV
jgi:hypothetical protein